MKCLTYLLAALIAAVTLAPVANAADETRTYQIKNRLRIEHDDNIYEEPDNENDSFKIIEEVEVLVNLNFEQSYIGLRYRPTFEWWDEREPDDDDLHHDFDVVLAHNFTPRLSLSVKDTFRLGEQPEAIEGSSLRRENGDFIYNVADGSASYLLRPGTRLEGSGRYTLLRYDDEGVANEEDYDIYAGGLTLRHELSPETVVRGEYRLEEVEYDGPDRGSQSQFLGLGLERVFSPNLLGDSRVGYQQKDFNEEDIDDEDSPYIEGSFTYLPSPQTRLTAGASYSLFESDIAAFASQERTTAFISAAYDVTARVSLYGAASYQMGTYDADQRIEENTDVYNNEDGDENVVQFSARLSYKLNRDNWLEANFHYLDVDSDLRDDYDRTRMSLGWRTQI